MSLFSHLAVKVGSAFLAFFNSVIGFLSFIPHTQTHGLGQVRAVRSCVPAAQVRSSSASSQLRSSAPVLRRESLVGFNRIQRGLRRSQPTDLMYVKWAKLIMRASTVLMLWFPGPISKTSCFKYVVCLYTYLSKLVYLLDHSSKQSAHTLINQTLHVMDRLLVRQVQSELVLHLEAKKYHSCTQSEVHRENLTLFMICLYNYWLHLKCPDKLKPH